MKRFSNHQRVTVTHPLHPLKGYSGQVVRLRIADIGAWVQMDARQEGLAVFPFPADDPRSNNTLLWPDECKPESNR